MLRTKNKMKKETIKFEEYFDKNTDEWERATFDSSDFIEMIKEETKYYIYYTCWNYNLKLTFWFRNRKKICECCGREL